MSTGCFGKLWHIPGGLEGHVHTFGKDLKMSPVFHLWLTLRGCRNRTEGEGRPAHGPSCEGVPYTHSSCWKDPGVLLAQAFLEISYEH